MSSCSAVAAVDDSALELVTAGPELLLEAGDEHPEVGVRRAWVHLRYEKDSQSRYPRVTWRSPRHISSVVPSPQRMYRGVVGTPCIPCRRCETS